MLPSSLKEIPPPSQKPSWVKSKNEIAAIPRNFNFFSEEQYCRIAEPVAPTMNFYNCHVVIGEKKTKQKTTERKRLRIMSSPSSPSSEEC